MTARAGVLLACLALLPWPVAAQGIGDAAAKEKDRRAKEAQGTQGQGKAAQPQTFTNDDLPSGKDPAAKDEQAGAPPAAPTPLSEPKGAQSDRAASERAYTDAVAAAQRKVDALGKRLNDLQAMLNPMSSTYIYGGATGGTANDEIRVRNEIRDVEGQLAGARQALDAATTALSEFRLGRNPKPPATH